MAEPAVLPRLPRDPRDQFHPPSPAVAERLRADFARTQEQLAANLANHPAVAARRQAEAEAAAEADLLATDPQQDLAAAKQQRTEARQAIAECEAPLAQAVAFVGELQAQERAAREAEIMAAARLAQTFTRGEAPQLELSAVGETARRRSVAQAAVEQLEQALSSANDRLAEAEAAVRRAAIAIVTVEGVRLAQEIEEMSAAIANKRASLYGMTVAVTTAARRDGVHALFPARIQRVLVEFPERGMIDAGGPSQVRIAELVA
jgi:chromosome segregation ATPase